MSDEAKRGGWAPGHRPRLWCLGSACALLLLGIWWRWLTLTDVDGAYGHVLGRLAYSDITLFYGWRDLAAHAIPYLEQDVEYPVLTGLTIWLTSYAPGVRGYFLVNAALLSACALACLALLLRQVPSNQVARFALAPGLALYTVLNWDMLALLGLTAGLYAFSRRQPGLAGVSLGLGASAKFFPAFILPVLLVHCLRPSAPALADGTYPSDEPRPLRSDALRLVAGFLAATAVLNVPFAALDFSGWGYPWTHQAGRDPNLDAIWTLLPAVPPRVVDLLFAGGVLAGVSLASWRVWRGARWEVGALLILLSFLLLTKVYSPQYDLWLLPLLAILACPWRLWALYVLADLAYYVAIFVYWHRATGGTFPLDVPALQGLLNLTIAGREFSLILLFTWCLILLDWPAPPMAESATQRL